MKRVFTIQERTAMIAQYQSGVTSTALAETFACSRSGIISLLIRRSIARRNKGVGRPCKAVNPDAFLLMTESSAYWAGMLMADGCISESTYGQKRIYLTLHIKDIDHLLQFRDFISPSSTVHYSKDGCARIFVTSDLLSDRLIKLGITPRKSLTAIASKELRDDRHFWRGVVDGDGNVSTRSNRGYLYQLGSIGLMKQFATFIRCNIPRWKGRDYRYDNIARVVLEGVNATALLDLLYRNSTVRLERKYLIARTVCVF